MFKENAEGITGNDEVDCLLLLCLQKSPFAFEIGPEGAGLEGKCLAGIAPVDEAGKTHKGDGNDG